MHSATKIEVTSKLEGKPFVPPEPLHDRPPLTRGGLFIGLLLAITFLVFSNFHGDPRITIGVVGLGVVAVIALGLTKWLRRRT